jgi:hypothetical protein
MILGEICMEQKRFGAMVRWKGIEVQGARYYCQKMTEYIGHKVEVRMGPDRDRVAIYTLPERKFISEATLSTV